jgi:hypothetical protein
MDYLEIAVVVVAIVASAAYALITLLPGSARLALARVLNGRAPQWIIGRLTRGTGCDTCAGNPALRPGPGPRR